MLATKLRREWVAYLASVSLAEKELLLTLLVS